MKRIMTLILAIIVFLSPFSLSVKVVASGFRIDMTNNVVEGDAENYRYVRVRLIKDSKDIVLERWQQVLNGRFYVNIPFNKIADGNYDLEVYGLNKIHQQEKLIKDAYGWKNSYNPNLGEWYEERYSVSSQFDVGSVIYNEKINIDFWAPLVSVNVTTFNDYADLYVKALDEGSGIKKISVFLMSKPTVKTEYNYQNTITYRAKESGYYVVEVYDNTNKKVSKEIYVDLSLTRLNFEVKKDRDVLYKDQEFELAYVFKPSGEVNLPRKNVSVVLVLDSSNSMNDSNKMPLARKAAKYFLQLMYQNANDYDKVGIVDFDTIAKDVSSSSLKNIKGNYSELYNLIDKIRYDMEFYPKKEKNNDKWIVNYDRYGKAIYLTYYNGIYYYSGGTNLHFGLEKANNYLINDNNEKYVIIITDGMPTFYNGSDGRVYGKGSEYDIVAGEKALEVVDNLRNKNIKVHAIGIATNFNDIKKEFVEKIANNGNGRSYITNVPEDIAKFLADIYMDIMYNIRYDEIQIKQIIPQDLEVLDLPQGWSVQDNVLVGKINPIIFENKKGTPDEIIFKVKFKSKKAKVIDLGKATLTCFKKETNKEDLIIKQEVNLGIVEFTDYPNLITLPILNYNKFFVGEKYEYKIGIVPYGKSLYKDTVIDDFTIKFKDENIMLYDYQKDLQIKYGEGLSSEKEGYEFYSVIAFQKPGEYVLKPILSYKVNGVLKEIEIQPIIVSVEGNLLAPKLDYIEYQNTNSPVIKGVGGSDRDKKDYRVFVKLKDVNGNILAEDMALTDNEGKFIVKFSNIPDTSDFNYPYVVEAYQMYPEKLNLSVISQSVYRNLYIDTKKPEIRTTILNKANHRLKFKISIIDKDPNTFYYYKLYDDLGKIIMNSDYFTLKDFNEKIEEISNLEINENGIKKYYIEVYSKDFSGNESLYREEVKKELSDFLTINGFSISKKVVPHNSDAKIWFNVYGNKLEDVVATVKIKFIGSSNIKYLSINLDNTIMSVELNNDATGRIENYVKFRLINSKITSKFNVVVDGIDLYYNDRHYFIKIDNMKLNNIIVKKFNLR